MSRKSLAFLVLGLGLGGCAIATQSSAPASVKSTVVVAKSLDETAAKGTITEVEVQAINDAVAGAVIGALKTQFPERDVEFKLGTVKSERASLRDIALKGTGEIRLEGSTAWMPIRFDALFDSDTRAVGSPSIIITPTAAGTTDKSMDLTALDAAVERKLSAEFGSKVTFDLGAVSVVGGDTRYAVADGNGSANFRGQGRSNVTVHGVYDRTAKRWVRIDYAVDGRKPKSAVPAKR